MRIALADHHPPTLWALKTTFQEEPGIEIVGEAIDTQGLLKLAQEPGFDLVLVDRDLPGIAMEELISILHTFEPRRIVVVMSSHIEDGRKMLRAGADIFASKADPPEWLVEKLRWYATRTQ